MPKINLSKFICKELVYDYLTGKLEPSRRERFQEFMREDIDLKQKVETHKHSFRYIGELKKVELSEEYLTYLCKQHSFAFGYEEEEKSIIEPVVPAVIEEALEEDEGPSFWERNKELLFVLRRSGEAFGLALVVFLVVKMIPDQYFQSDFWSSKQQTVLLEESDINLTETTQKPEKPTKPALVAKEEAKDSSTSNKNQVKPVPATIVAKVTEPKVKKRPTLNGQTANIVAKTEKPAQVQYFLYRSIIQVQDLDGVTAEFLSYLESVGAKKAGKVRLGWVKPNARYFHFHVNELEQENIVKFLKSKGNFNLNKISHWRKTPKDQIRVIVEIRQKGI